MIHKVPISPLIFEDEDTGQKDEDENEDRAEWIAALKFLRGTARFHAATVGCGATRLNVLNVYGFSGANTKHTEALRNENFLEAVALVAAGLGDVPTIIVGDFNVELEKSGTLTSLLRRGWVDAATAFGSDKEPSFFATEEVTISWSTQQPFQCSNRSA